LLFAIRNPFVATGILFLLVFFGSYLAALSRADLTYVLPATSLGDVVVALLSKFFLYENVTASRWLGIGLISAGVGIVANGPVLTENRGPGTGDRKKPKTLWRFKLQRLFLFWEPALSSAIACSAPSGYKQLFQSPATPGIT